MYYLYHFTQDGAIEGEYLVISENSRATVIKEFTKPGFAVTRILAIEDDATCLPCDRELTVS